MIIMLGSKNPSKCNALKIALESLNIQDFEILAYSVNSNVASKPIGIDMINGINNRNNELKKIALKENIEYDYLVSIEGGFEEDISGKYFIITYCGIEDKDGNIYIGKSQGFPISNNMFEYTKQDKSLNRIIENINKSSNNKQHLGITGYLSNGLIIRELFDSQAVISAFSPLIFNKNYESLEKHIKKKRNKI